MLAEDASGASTKLLTRLENLLKDNGTLKKLYLQPYVWCPPVYSKVAKAVLKGASHNKGLERMVIMLASGADIHKSVDRVKEENKDLLFHASYNKVIFLLLLWYSM